MKQCTACHVGSRHGGEVNHDLIAAGHPALRFEYVWYQSRLPKHWKPGRRDALARQKAQEAEPKQLQAIDDKSLREWLVGQLVTAIASLEQLDRRVERGGQHEAGVEFAEFNCFACHHGLRGMTWRRERGIPGLAAFGGQRSRVSVPWGNWSLDLISTLADQHDSPDAREFSATFGRLREVLQTSHPSGLEVITRSEAARRHAQAWLKEVARLSNRDAGQILQQVGLRQSEQLISSWDQMAKVLLGFAAPYHASDSIPESLKVAMDRVRFPQTPTIINSPAQFRSTDIEPSLTADKWFELLRQLARLRDHR